MFKKINIDAKNYEELSKILKSSEMITHCKSYSEAPKMYTCLLTNTDRRQDCQTKSYLSTGQKPL